MADEICNLNVYKLGAVIPVSEELLMQFEPPEAPKDGPKRAARVAADRAAAAEWTLRQHARGTDP